MGSITPTASKRITWDIISDMWHAEKIPNGYLSVGIAENTLMHSTLVEYIHDDLNISAQHLSYNNGSMRTNALRKAVSHFLNRHFNPFRPVEQCHVLMTNGCSSAIEHLSWTFLNPVVVPVEMGAIDPLSPEAVDLYERAAVEFEQRTGKRVRAVMLCNTHNPLGRCYPRGTVDGLMRLCQSRQMHLISDEIYALSVWENRVERDVPFEPFGSLLAMDTTGLIDAHLVHVLWGMSKDFGANGLRVGAVISQGKELNIAQKCLSLYSFVLSLSDQITASIMENDAFTDDYIRTNREKLSESHAFLVSLLKKHGIEYSRGCNAGFFLWVNLGKKYLETHPHFLQSLEFTDMLFQRLLDNKNPGWFRLVFAHPLP
ncbi:pyridoxal phosphate-dependent transferase [Aspergillus similis]